jgi:ABC-2 type transport system permease protein
MLSLLIEVNALQLWRRFKAIRQQSRLLTGTIFLFIAGYLSLSFWLFYEGLGFIASFPGLGTVLTERLLYLLFAFLFVLLLLSNLIISYTNLFRNRETAYLLTMPVPRETIFQWKFIESTLLASWAFLFLIAPLVAAFGITRHVAWHFYVATPVLTALFIGLPAVAGCWTGMQVARYLDRRAFQIAAVACTVLLVVGAAFWWRQQASPDDLVETRVLDMLDELLAKTRFVQFPFLPSYWLANSVIQWSEGVLNLATFFGLVLLSHVAFFGLLAFTRLGSSFYETASAVQSRASMWGQWEWFRSRSRRPRGFKFSPGPLERFFNLFWWVRPDTRALLIKDARTFWRDTTQWGQSVVLFGLLGVYIINLRHFTRQMSNPFWLNLISYLNLGACSLNLATVTTRFVFPQFSLEGRRLWIIGLAPMGLARVVKTKYFLATGTSLCVTLGLIILSSWLLRMSFDRIAFFGAVITVMTFALNGLAVGFGVLYPNLKEANPNKIVSGFGGTLCLVLSFFYILGSLLMLGFGTTGLHSQSFWVVMSVGGFTVLSFLIGWVPLRLAFSQLNKFEF